MKEHVLLAQAKGLINNLDWRIFQARNAHRSTKRILSVLSKAHKRYVRREKKLVALGIVIPSQGTPA
ncbi:MAG: hypothetical protein ACU837_10670 [Gammaproteobacteria bacterium]